MMATLQQSNINIMLLTEKLAKGEGTVGKLLSDESLYNDLLMTAQTLRETSVNARQITASVASYSANLNREGTLAHDLVTDTMVFNRLRSSVAQLQKAAGTTSATIDNLKAAVENPNSPLGVLTRDDASGAKIRATISNLEEGSATLNEDLKALQHSFLLRKGIKKEEKAKEKAQEEQQQQTTP